MSLLTTAMMFAPPAVKAFDRYILGGSRPSSHEKKLFRMADVFGDQASVPITENRSFKSGMSILDERDRKNRKAINNSAASSGATDEAKLATIDSSNESYSRAMNRLLENAERFQRYSQDREISLLNMAEGAKQNRVAHHTQNLSSILDPVGEAGKAFAMADLFADDSTPDTPDFSKFGTDRILYPNGVGGGTTRDLFLRGR